MGTTYSIKYLFEEEALPKSVVDSVLLEFNMSLSTYIENSEISRFNQDSSITFDLPYFLPVLEASQEIFIQSDGAFDPTVMPLVKAWGFGPDRTEFPDSASIDSLRTYVGYEKVTFNSIGAAKTTQGVQLDFSAVAKGYGVDVVAQLFGDRNVRDFFVEIGGEIRASGSNVKGEPWRVGVDDPVLDGAERSIKAVIELKDRAMATSGNYRNYYIRDGVRFAHTIDPRTGYPVEHSLLSASVFAQDCMTADAWATAFMVGGLDFAKKVSKSNPELEAFLIYDNGKGQIETLATSGVEVIMVAD